MASALVSGKCWREQYTPEKIRDPTVLSLAEKVDVVKDDELDALYDEKWPSIVEVETGLTRGGGPTILGHIKAARDGTYPG